MEESKELRLQSIVQKIGEGNSRICQSINDTQDQFETWIMMGSTGVGKTTTSHYLAGNELEAYENKKGKIVIKSIKESLQNSKISTNLYDSETKIPNLFKYSYENKSIILWDCPGFADTEGIDQEIPNAFYINQIFQTSEKIKFLLVVKDSYFDEKGFTQFLSTLDNFIRSFKDISILENHISLIVTKCQIKQKEEHIFNSLDEIIEGVQNTNKEKQIGDPEKIIQMIKYLQKNIIIINEPSDIGPITINPDIQQKIIQNTSPIEKVGEQSNIAISVQSQQIAEDFFQQSNEIFNKKLCEVADLIQTRCAQINSPENISKKIVYNEKIIEKVIYTGYFKLSKRKITRKTVEKKEIETYKQLFAVEDIYSLQNAIEQITGMEKQQNIPNKQLLTQIVKIIDDVFQTLNKFLNDAEKTEHQDIKKDIHEKLEYVNFLEIVTQKKVVIKDISQHFMQAQQQLTQAFSKGLQGFKISLDEDIEYYQKIIEITKKGQQIKQQPENDQTLGSAYFCLAQLYLQDQKYEDSVLAISESLFQTQKLKQEQRHYQENLQLFQKNFFNSQEKITQIILEQQKIKNLPFLEDLFSTIFQDLNSQLQNLNTILTLKLSKSYEFQWYPSQPKEHFKPLDHLKLLNDLRHTIKDIIKSGQFTDQIDQQGVLFTNSLKIYDLLQLTIDTEKMMQKFPDYTEICVNINNLFQGLQYLNKNHQNSSKNEQINKLNQQFFQNLYLKQIEEQLIQEIKSFKIQENTTDTEYLLNLMVYLEKMPESHQIAQIRSEVFKLLGDIAYENKELDKSIENYNKAININKGIHIIYNKLGKIYEEKQDYSNALKNYKILRNHPKIMLCYKKIKQSFTNLISQAQYLASILQFQQANDLLLNISSKCGENPQNAQKVYQLLYDVNDVQGYQTTVKNEFLKLKNGSVPIYPVEKFEKLKNNDTLLD